jgi:GMP synthase-like glutamine amidotransferase
VSVAGKAEKETKRKRDMNMLYIIQNDPEVPPGLVGGELDRLGVEWTTVHPCRGEPLPELSATNAIIVLGGAMGANDDAKHPFLTGLKGFIREVAARDIPYLGICLGGQLLAAALGAGITSGVYVEKGTHSVTLTDAGADDRLFEGIGREFVSFQWHNDSFAIPEEAVRLASSPACPNQAFRVGSRVWGTQFHPEVDERIVREWSSWTPETAARTEVFVSDYRHREDDYRRVCRHMVANFLEAAEVR